MAASDKEGHRVWSEASSTGQEAYGLTILIAEYSRRFAAWGVNIIGTDI